MTEVHCVTLRTLSYKYYNFQKSNVNFAEVCGTLSTQYYKMLNKTEN